MNKLIKLLLIMFMVIGGMFMVGHDVYALDDDNFSGEIEQEEQNTIADSSEIINDLDNTDDLQASDFIEVTDMKDAIENPVHPDDETPSYAYAVLKSNGDFIFVRSYNTYNNASSGTLINIDGDSYGGIIFSGVENTPTSYTMPWSTYLNNIKKVYAVNEIKPKNMYNWFYNCDNLISFDQKNINTSDVVSMVQLFMNCRKLDKLNLSDFVTTNVKSFAGIFRGCEGLTYLDLSNFNTEKAESLSQMFYLCNKLKGVNISSFNTANVTNTSNMFGKCKALESLDLSNFDLGNVTYMQDMFEDTNSLKSIKLGKKWTKWLNEARIPNGVWVNKERNLYKSDTELYNQYPSSANSMSGTWEYVRSYAVLLDDGDFVFTRSENDYENGVITTLIDINGYGYTGRIFADVEKTTNGSLWSAYRDLIQKVYAVSTIRPISLMEWFSYCENLVSFNGFDFDTTGVRRMDSMFSMCSSLSTVNVQNFDTSDVEEMYLMFRSTDVESLDLSNFITTNVYGCYGMFLDCKKLKYLDISNFDTSSITKMGNMFDNCLSLKTIKLGEKFTVWKDDAYLPEGTWHNYSKDLHKTETELYDDYPSQASAWAGTWTLNNTGLDTPQLKSIFNVKNGIDVRFAEVKDATSYIFIRIANGKETIVGEVKAEDIPEKYGYKNWTDTSVKSEYGKGFAYKVIAKKGLIESEPSEQLAIFRLNEPTITKLETKSNSVKVSWNKEKVHRYVLQYSVDGNNWTTIETTATSRTITGLKSNTTYYFRVRGVMVQKDGTIHYSQYSTRKSVKTK